jgi:hypothetical protein
MARVIVVFTNGREVAGEALFFNPQKMAFPFQFKNAQGKLVAQDVSLGDVKKILFLKKEPGTESRIHSEKIEDSHYASSVSFRLLVEFLDGEILVGTSIKSATEDKGFFLVPMNPAENSERIYINSAAVKTVQKGRLLGKILTEKRLVNESALLQALRHQENIRAKKIGTIMVEEKMINQGQLDESLAKQKWHKRMLGEILVEAGYVTSEQLERALAIQRENKKKKLGQILVELKYVAPNDICIALASQLNCSWVDLSTMALKDDDVTLLPEEAVRATESIPIGKEVNGTIIVATSDPNIAVLMQKMAKYTPQKIRWVIAYDGYLDAALQHFFPKKAEPNPAP